MITSAEFELSETKVGEPFNYFKFFHDPEILPLQYAEESYREEFISGGDSNLSPKAQRLMRQMIVHLLVIAKERESFNALVAEMRSIGYHKTPNLCGISAYDNEGGTFALSVPRLLDVCEMPLCPPDPAPRQKVARKEKYTASVVERLGYAPDAWVCTYCLKEGTTEIGPDQRRWHVDHVYPRVLGGDDKSDNKVLSCATCNLKKNRKTGDEFRAALEAQNG